MARVLRTATAVVPWALLLAAWLASTAFTLARLPERPYLDGDSALFVDLAPSRPPAYGWLLYVFRALGDGPDYAHLPLVQTLLLAVALIALAWQLALLLRAPLAGAAVVLLVSAHAGFPETAYTLRSEGLFLPAVLVALACAAAHVRSNSAAALAATAFCCAIATLTRTAGAALLLLPPLLVLLDAGIGGRRMARRLALVVLVVSLPLLSAMAWQQGRHGAFAIGSNTGISLLGKALLLLRPEQAGDEVLARVAPLAQQAREAIAVAPGYAASLRAQTQASEDLRWNAFVPAAAAAWPAWRDADPRGQAKIAGAAAWPIITADAAGYALLVVRDWTALLIYPHFWPAAWHARNTAHPFFARCGERRMSCWWIERRDPPRFRGLAMIGTSIGGLVATAVLLGVCGARAVRRRLTPVERLMLAFVLVAQATLAGSAAFEVGLWRYAIVPHVLHAALVAWLGVAAVRGARINRGSS